MIFLTLNDADRLLKKYCPNASSLGGCESGDLFFLYVFFFIVFIFNFSEGSQILHDWSHWILFTSFISIL